MQNAIEIFNPVTRRWHRVADQPLDIFDYQSDVVYRFPLQNGQTEYWWYRGQFPENRKADWGLYIDRNGCERFHGRSGWQPPDEYFRTIESDSDNVFLDVLASESQNIPREPRGRSSVKLKYEIHPEDSAIVAFIKSEFNKRDLDLSFIINELNCSHNRAYNLHNSLNKNHVILYDYVLVLSRLLGYRVGFYFEDVGLDHTRTNGVQEDFDIDFR